MKTLAVILALSSAAPAAAQSLVPPGPNPPGRYQIQPVEGGVARLDTATGDISFCRLERAALRCRPSENAAARDDDEGDARASRGDGERASRQDEGRRDESRRRDDGEDDDAPRRGGGGSYSDDDRGSDRGGAMRERSDRDDDGGDAELDRTIGRIKQVFRTFRDIARDFEAEGRAADAAPSPDRT